ncbi:hypothetical protein [Endozoicomonas sp.]
MITKTAHLSEANSALMTARKAKSTKAGNQRTPQIKADGKTGKKKAGE